MIALLTDFGTRDPFAGILKGVIAGINAGANVMDLTHEIPPQDIRRAALVLGDSYHYFPKGTIFVCVIDPDVGSSLRRPLCVQAGEHFFVGPDNGTFTVPISEHPNATRAWEIRSSKYLLPVRGSTFHGRDIYAPVAAWLSKGIEPWELGPEAGCPALIELPRPGCRGGVITGEVVMIDRFGNAITNIRAADIEAVEGQAAVTVGDRTFAVVSHYSEATDAQPHALLNSEGRIEIFIFMGSAVGTLALRLGDEVTVASGSDAL